jgi:hypothetical protein
MDGIASSVRLRRLVDEWWRSNPRLAATTQAHYRDNLENHILPTLGDKKVSDIRPRLVAAFLQQLLEKEGVSLPNFLPTFGSPRRRAGGGRNAGTSLD